MLFFACCALVISIDEINFHSLRISLEKK